MDLVQVVEAVFVTETELQHLCRHQIRRVKISNLHNTQGSLIN